MLSMMSMYDQNRSDHCILCNKILTDIKAYPNVCDHYFHYKCLRNYVDNRIDKCESIICPICNKIFNQIANKFKKSKDILFQNVILSNDETQCCICFSKYKTPVASTDSCSHSFCFECLRKWCTVKHECPMDRMPVKLLLVSDFPGGHITKKEAPPPIEQDLNGDGDNDEILNTTCEVCNLGNNDHQLLLCDNCNRGYHIYCLSNPLSEIPEGDWFCEECSNDMGISNQILPRGIRGLQHVIDNLQSRYTNGHQNHQNENARSTRGRRNQTRTQHYSSDESDPSSESLPRLRNRRRTTEVRVRRSRRNIAVNSDVASTVSNSAHMTRQDEIPVVSGSNDESLSRSRRRIIEDSEEEQEAGVVENERLTLNDESSSPKGETAVNSRNRQGSLSSEAESEMDPTRRKSEESESYKESSAPTSDDDSVTSLQATARKRGRAQTQSYVEAEEDSPLPRPIKRPRMIDESSEESSEDPDESIIVGNSRKRKIMESSDSNDSTAEEEEYYTNSCEEEERKRNFSTSSSLSTIPCRLPLASTSRAQSIITTSTVRPSRYRSMKYPISDTTDSDCDQFIERISREPSTSQRQSTSRRSKGRRRKTTSKRTTKKSSKKSKSARKSKTNRVKRRVSSRISRQAHSTHKEFDIGNSVTLSLFGREKQLPVVTDEELNIKRVATAPTISAVKPNTSSNSILSEINEAQTNFRHISFSTVVRLSDGTLIHKSRTEPNDSRENKDPKHTPSTSSSEPQASSSVSPTVSHNHHHQQQQQQQQPVSHSKPMPTRPKPPVQIVHPMTETIPIPKPEPQIPICSSTNNVSNSGRSAVDTKTSSEAHINKINNTIKKFLDIHFEKGDITSDENIHLSARITEKIMKRNNQSKTPGDQSIKDFSKKYLKFYLSRRK